MINLQQFVLLLILTLFNNTLFAAPGGGRASPVAVADVELRMMAPHVWVTAEVISRSDAGIASEVAGRLMWVAEVGSLVQVGEPLAKIDSTVLQQQLDEQTAIIAREQASLDFLDQEVARLKSLVKQRNVSQSALDQTVANRAVAKGDLAVAKVRAQQVAERLKRSTISAPFTGVVSGRLLQSGEWVDTGEAVAHLVDTQNKEVRAWVTEQVLPFVRLGDDLTLELLGQRHSAKIAAIVPVGSSASRLHEIRLSLPVVDWRIGQPLRVAAPTAQPQQQLSVPRDALVLRRDGSFVFRVKEDGSAERIKVTTGVAMGEFIEVKGSLQAGDKVVVNGGERLRPGQQVKVVNAAGAGR